MKPLKTAAGLVLAAGLGAALGAFGTPDSGWIGAAYGAVGGVLTYAGFLAYRALVPRIGRYTAVAAMSVLLGTAFLVLALLGSTCPGSIDAGEGCSQAETGTWLLVGILLPVAWALFLFPPAAIGRAGRWLWRRRRQQKVEVEEQVVTGRTEKVQRTGRQEAQRRARKAQRRARKAQRPRR